MESVSTTILAVRRDGEVVVGGDGQVTVLEALLLAVDRKHMLLLSGNGDIIEPDEPVLAIGSGGDVARASALALYRNTELNAEEIVRKSLQIASEICIYTNANFTVEKL